MAGFKFSLFSDTSRAIGPIRTLADRLDDVAESLDDVARDGDRAGDNLGDGMRDASRDADKFERKFSDAYRSIRTDSKKTGKDIGDDVRDGTRRAENGMEDLRDESKSTAREAAASFGDVEDALDAVQEIAANAFGGFGAAGMAAGLVAAAGIGILFTQLQDVNEKIAEAKQAAVDLATELAEADGNPELLDWATRIQDKLTEIVDERKWYEFWQDEPVTAMEEWSDAADRFGLNFGNLARGLSGSSADIEAALAEIDNKMRENEDTALRYAQQGLLPAATAARQTNEGLRELREKLEEADAGMKKSRELADLLTIAQGGLADSAADAAAAVEEYEDKVSGALDGAGQAWEKYVEDGKLNLDEYNTAIEAQWKAVEQFEANLAAASKILSDEALAYIAALGPEAAPLLQAFIDAPLDQQERTATNWDKIGRASSDGYESGLDLTTPTEKEIGRAQDAADRRPVDIYTRLTGDLQGDLDRGVRRLRIPLVRVPYTFVQRAV